MPGRRAIATRIWPGAFVAAILIGAFAAAQPQTAPATTAPRALHLGETVHSVLDEHDSLDDERYYEEYVVTLAKDDVIQVDMEADSSGPALNLSRRPLDTYLEIYPSGNRNAGERNDDRAPGNLNSRIVYTVPASGDYVIRAQGFDRNQGSYALTATNLGRAIAPVPLSGNHVTGRFGSDSALGEEHGDTFRYLDYQFQGAAQERVRFTLNVGDSPGRLQLRAPDHSLIAQDDGYGGNSKADLFAVLPDPGIYTVRVRVSADSTVAYALDLVRLAAIPAAHLGVLHAGPPTPGELTLGSGARTIARRAEIFYFYEDYTLDVRQGEPVTIRLDSEDFDPVLEAGTMSPIGFAVAAYNDDTNQLNSQLVLTPDRTGQVYLRARSLGPSVGRFRLTVTPGLPPPPSIPPRP